jgi:hypothetical protein
MTNPKLPELIFIVDDALPRGLLRALQSIFPAAGVVEFKDGAAACAYMENTGKHPDLALFDTTSTSFSRSAVYQGPEWGANNAKQVIECIQTNSPSNSLPPVLFVSGDLSFAWRSKAELNRRLRQNSFDDIHVATTEEVRLVGELSETSIYNVRSFWTQENESTLTEFRTFLNDRFGFSLPLSQADYVSPIPSPQEAVDLYFSYQIKNNDALGLLAPYVEEWVDQIYGRHINYTEPDYFYDAAAVNFIAGVGGPVAGYAAFNAEDIAANQAQNHPSVLILRDAPPDILQQFRDVAAIVLTDPSASGHIAEMATAFGVSGLMARAQTGNPRVLRFHHERTNKKGESLPASLAARNLVNIPVDDQEVLSNLKEICVQTTDTGGNSWSSVNNIFKITYASQFTIKAGDPISIDPENQRLLKGHVTITDGASQIYGDARHLYVVRDILAEWQAENGFKPLNFTTIIDRADQARVPTGNGIGIVRSESLVMGDATALAGLKSYLIDSDRRGLENFVQSLEDCYRTILGSGIGASNYPIRIRFLDAPPTEIMSSAESKVLDQRCGQTNTRGVQLGLRLPEIYEGQVRAIFEARQKEIAARDYDVTPTPVEILVPLVRNLEELLGVKAMVQTIAKELRVSEDHYKFGAMIETLEACAIIETLAPHCDFISYGGNDLSSALLGYSRENFTSKQNFMDKERSGEDPSKILHPKVVDLVIATSSKARSANLNIKIAFCGAQGASLESLNRLRPANLDSVAVVPNEMNLYGLPILYGIETFRQQPNTPRLQGRGAQQPHI